MPGGRLAPALDDVFIALVEGVLEVQQRHHQPGGQTWPAGVGDTAASDRRHRAKQVQILDLLAGLDLTRPALGQGRLDLLPGHAVGQHRKRVAQIDHLVQAVAEEIVGHGAAFKNSQKTALIEYVFGSFEYSESPQIASIHADCRVLQGRLIKRDIIQTKQSPQLAGFFRTGLRKIQFLLSYLVNGLNSYFLY